jgi:hypothetical protein
MAAKKPISIIKKPIDKIKKRYNSFLKRRPHRSFRRTRRRDYVRSLKLPGYISFTLYVNKTLWKNRKVFGLLALLYIVLTVLLTKIASQDIYSTLKDTIDTTSGDLFGSAIGELGKASLLFVTSASGGISQSLTEAQQIYAGIIALLMWMTSVWLLRNILAGHKIKLRDGLYSAGAPIISTFIVALVFVVQLLPLALALIGYAAASATGLLSGGVEAMLFWIAAGFLALLSIYWSTSTFFALVIVTLPGMYPFKALQIAGDLVVGRRLRILLRLLWMIVVAIVTWAIIMIPIIMIDGWAKDTWSAIYWVPTIPIILLLLGSLTIIWISSYVYLFYRKVVADEAAPA